MYKAIFFDLDGTLLPMDLDEFLNYYFELVATFMTTKGINGRAVVDGVWAGTQAMFEADGISTNEKRFWKRFKTYMGQDHDWETLFEEFYGTWFARLQEKVVPNPLVGPMIEQLHKKGFRLVLATNPLFPTLATSQRLSWTGAEASYFERVTSFENSFYAKPSRHYFEENLAACKLDAAEVLMVGNDTRDDALASTVGIDTYIICDCLIEHETQSIPLDTLKHGTMQDFVDFVESLPACV